MKIQSIIFTLLILFAAFQTCVAQLESEPKLLDSIKPRNCESVLQRVDSLIEEVSNNPNSIGYIIISWRPTELNEFGFGRLAGFVYEDKISIQLKRKNFDQSRIKIIRSDGNQLKIDFVITPDKSVQPSYLETSWDLSIPKKAVLFDEGYGGQLCDATYLNLKVFSEFLNANPTSRGHFVIYAKSFGSFKEAKEWLSHLLVNEYKLSLKRFRFFFIKDNNNLYTHEKVWIVPQNKK